MEQLAVKTNVRLVDSVFEDEPFNKVFIDNRIRQTLSLPLGADSYFNERSGIKGRYLRTVKGAFLQNENLVGYKTQFQPVIIPPFGSSLDFNFSQEGLICEIIGPFAGDGSYVGYSFFSYGLAYQTPYVAIGEHKIGLLKKQGVKIFSPHDSCKVFKIPASPVLVYYILKQYYK